MPRSSEVAQAPPIAGPSAYATAQSAQADRNARQNPVFGGISIGGYGDAHYTGTLGAIVYHRATKVPVALSNWHVLCNYGSGKTVQPGVDDDPDTGRNALGTVVGNAFTDQVDAAVSTLGQRGYTATILGLGIGVEDFVAPTEGMHVVKSGKRTNVSWGLITAIDQSVQYHVDGHGLRDLQACIIVADPERSNPSGFCGENDSGACWMLVENGRVTGQMVGLHTASGNDGSAWACHADRVAGALGIEPLPAPAPLGAAPPALTAALPPGQPHGVLARHGLWLRGGPGLDFPRLELLAPGRTVHVVGASDAWRMIDLCGDGQVDGFAYGAFLTPLGQRA